MDGEKQEDSNSRSAAATSSSASAAVTMATVCPSSSLCTRAPSSSLSVISPDRTAVQVIQHAIQRPQSLAAQLLHQMYAAQQQHLMLQTAALQQQQQQQQQHSPHLQSLATIHQASICQRQSTSPSSNGLVHQPAGVSISLPASPVTAQLVGRTQNSISSGVSTTISQQAMLLGGRPTNCNQAQMYLRTQMLILTPAASVAPVQSDLPAVTSCSSASNASQGLVLHHLPGALAAALTPAAPKTSVYPLQSSQVSESSSERGQSEVTGAQVLTPALYPAQTPLKQQRSYSPGHHQAAHCQLIPQQATGAALNHRQLQPVSPSVSLQDTSSYPAPFLSQSQSSPGAQSQMASSARASTSLTSATSAQTSVPAAKVQPQPPPLMAAPQRRSSFPQLQSRPPPPPLVLPRFPPTPPAALQRLSLHSVQALAIQSRQLVLKEQELSATEGLVQTPYQSLPPPQTVAVDLKVQPVPIREAPLSGQTRKGNSLSLSEKKDESPHLSSQSSPPLLGSPKQNGGAVDSPSSLSSHSMIRPLATAEPSHLTTSSATQPPSPTQPPRILPAAVRCPSRPPSSPSSPNGPLTTHVLTHLVEGFVVQEGLEPFPVVPSLHLKKKQASLPDSHEVNTNQDAAREESPLEVNPSDSSDSELENNGPAADVAEHGERVGALLRCEYCGARGYARMSLRSKRFCSMMCVRRFSKHITLLRAGRWGQRAAGRRGRPPSRVDGYPREHFLKQAYRSEKTREDREEEEEAPAPMTTRLRKQAERRRETATEKEREQHREQERPTAETISISDEAEEDRCPSHWDVEQVFSYISSLPGGEDVAEEFRSQEIDGQALLLLTEDHLVSAMNLKLGPALKLYAHIKSLKDS